MKRHLVVALAAMALIVGFAALPAEAHHKPGHGGTTTTTTPPPPTTTTTAPPPTTTTTTTPPPPECGPSITITTGGTYSGCYRSTDPAVPAVRISTTALVELDHARVEHAGHGLFVQYNGAQLNVHDSTFQKLATTPGAADQQRAAYVWGALRFNFDDNLLIDGDGVHWNEGSGTAIQASFLRNDIRNVGRYQPTDKVHAFHLSQTYMPDMEVAWNKITNQPGLSDVEDVISFYQGGGTSGHRIQTHHNLVDGAYPATLGFTSYFGSGIMLGDGAYGNPPGGPQSSFVDAHDNWVVSTSRAGIVAMGTDHEVYNNVIVNDGYANGVLTGPNPAGGAGLILFDNTSNIGNSLHDNTIGWNRVTSPTTFVRNDKWLPSAASPFDVYTAADDAVSPNNVSMPDPIDASDEQAARDAWDTARVAAGVTVGPRPLP